MPHLLIDFQPVLPELTLDDLISTIIDHIPGARITAEDWYADRRAEEKRNLESLRQRGRPMLLGDEIVSSVDRAAGRHGRTKGIVVPLRENGSLNGRISRGLMLLYSEVSIDRTAVDNLLEVLQPLGVVKDFKVSNVQPPWK